jgi:hypothetical protein
MVEIVPPFKTVGGDLGRFPANRAHLSSPGKKGRVRIGHLLLLLLLAAGAYLGVQAISAYVGYWSLTDTVRLTVREIAMARERVEEGETRILAKAQQLQLPLSERQVIVTVDAERVLARVRWQHPIGLLGYTIPLSFEIEESRSLR